MSASPVILAEQTSSYTRTLRGIVRALWNGTFDFYQAFDLFVQEIDLALTTAWHAGAAECGIAPDELSPEEQMALSSAIHNERGFVFSFLSDVETGNKASGSRLGPFLNRAELWGNRYNDVMNRARMMACADQKLIWMLGPTKEHCKTCARLAGKVKRASQWEASGWRPQGNMLACGGWRCLCSLELTDESLSKGPLPRA